MFYNVQAVKALPDFHLHVVFKNGEEKIYNVRPMIDEYEPFQAFLLTYKLFDQVKVEQGGYAVIWNDELDIACNELYYNGAKP